MTTPPLTSVFTDDTVIRKESERRISSRNEDEETLSESVSR